MHPIRAAAALCLAIATIAPAAIAHDSTFSVTTTPDRRLRIHAAYEGDYPMIGVAVKLRGRDGIALDARTAKDGTAHFDAPPPGYYRLTIDDDSGHAIEHGFTLAAHQLDGTVRDLIAETGAEPTLRDRLRSLPLWLWAIAGAHTLLTIVALVGWARARRT